MFWHRGGPQSTGLKWARVAICISRVTALAVFVVSFHTCIAYLTVYSRKLWEAPVWVSWQLVFAVEVRGGLVDTTSIPKGLYSIRPQNEFSIARTPFSQSRIFSLEDRNFDPGIHSCAHLRVLLDKARLSSTSSRVTGRDSPTYLGHDGFGTRPMVVAAIAEVPHGNNTRYTEGTRGSPR